MTRCFGYVRVSTLKQGDGASLAAQKDAIMAFASQNGLDVCEWYEELESASRRGRPVFDRMVKNLRAGRAQGLIVHRWDRTSRNYGDWTTISDLADDGVLVFAAGDNIDFASRSGRLMADIQMVLATDYSRNLSIEVKKGQSQRLKQGYWPFRAPLGYVDNGDGALKTLCPKKAPLVREVFDRYRSGEYSITSLTEVMRDRGLTGYYDRPLHRRNVEAILNNPFYCGQLQSTQGLFKGIHEPLITVKTFREIERIKADRSTKKDTKHVHLFRNMFWCGSCQARLTGERQKGRVYYRCHTPKCPERTIREDRLEAAITRRLKQLEWSDDDVEEMQSRLAQRDLFQEQKTIRTSLNLRAAEVQTRQSRLMDLFIDGSVSKEEFEMRKVGFAIQLAGIEEERRELLELERQQGYEAELLEFMMDLARLYEVSSPFEKRQLLKRLFVTRMVRQGCPVLTVRQQFKLDERGSEEVQSGATF